MTIETTATYSRASGNGVTTVFAFTFEVFDSTDLVVRDIVDATGVATTKTLTTDYTVALSATGEGGTVTFLVAPASGHTADLRSAIPLTQPTSIRNQGPFHPELHEGVFDRLERQIQDTRRIGALAMRLPDSELPTTDWDTIFDLASRKGKYGVFFNATTGAPELYASIGATTLSQSVIGAFLYPRTAAEIAAGVTPTNYFREPGDVRRYGAVGDGSTDDTTAITNAFLTGHVVKSDRSLNHKIVQVVINGKNFELFANGATFTLTGNTSGFLVKGVVTRGRVWGGLYNGDGVNRDASPATAQAAWSVGNDSGAQVGDVAFDGLSITNCNVGIKISDGRGGGGTKTKNCRVTNCYAYNMVGQVGGMGYGFQFTQADGATITNSTAENCERHGIYFAEGKDYTATNCIVKGGGFGAVRGGIVSSRSANVAISNCVIDGRNDTGLVIDIDTQGLAPDNISNGVTVTNMVINDCTLQDVKIGTDGPDVDGVVSNVLINGMVIRTLAGKTNNNVIITGGTGIVIKGLSIDSSAAGASQRAVRLSAPVGAIYYTDISISIDHLKTTGTGLGISVASSLCTGTQQLDLRVNQSSGGGAEFEFSSGEDSVTNTALKYRRSNGKATRSYTSSGALVSIPLGGITCLTLSASGATTVANFTGGVEGDEIDLFFSNGNTTLKATNFYLAGAVDFVGTANDCMRLVYKSGAWREISRSVN